MHEAQAVRVQELPLEAEVAPHAVHRVAGDGEVDRREVHADLVRPTGLETHVEERVLGERSTTSNRVTASRGSSVSSDLASGSRRSRPIGASIRPVRERGRPRTSAR